MRSHGPAAVWGTSLDGGRAREANGWDQPLKAWWAARKAVRGHARLAALTACWDAQHEAFTPRRTDAAPEMALAQGMRARVTQLYSLIQY
jgi:hypothetical protein